MHPHQSLVGVLHTRHHLKDVYLPLPLSVLYTGTLTEIHVSLGPILPHSQGFSDLRWKVEELMFYPVPSQNPYYWQCTSLLLITELL